MYHPKREKISWSLFYEIIAGISKVSNGRKLHAVITGGTWDMQSFCKIKYVSNTFVFENCNHFIVNLTLF